MVGGRGGGALDLEWRLLLIVGTVPGGGGVDKLVSQPVLPALMWFSSL